MCITALSGVNWDSFSRADKERIMEELQKNRKEAKHKLAEIDKALKAIQTSSVTVKLHEVKRGV